MAPKSPAGFLYNFVGRQLTDPTNYRFLQQAAGDVLSRAIPKNVNWGGLRTGFLDTLSNISNMAPGAAKEQARTQAKQTLVRAAAQPPTRPAGTFAGSGALRAPVVGTPPVRPVPTSAAPSTSLPGGGPFNIDYALRRATGFTGSPQQLAEKLTPSSFGGQLGQLGQQLGRGAQGLVDTSRGLLGRLPTQINPFATGTPTTTLGKVGKFFNPLNPANAIDFVNPMPGVGLGARLTAGLGLTGGAGMATTIGGGLLGAGAFDMLFPQGTADGTLKGKEYLTNRYMPYGGDASLRDEQGRMWAGKNYGFQSPESFNKLFGGAQQTTAGGTPPPAPTLPPFVDSGPQAGQLTTPPSRPPAAPAAPAVSAAPAAPVTPGGPVVLSNGAGAPAQRQNVKNRQLAQDVLNAAQQYAAPAGVPLSSFYAGQQQLGRSMEQGGELQRRLRDLGGAAGMSDQALMQWAKQNPGLAYRELLKLQNRNQQM
jgi:hypothetical protein